LSKGRHALIRIVVVAALAAATVATTTGAAGAAGAAKKATNQWLGMRVLNQVHQGGEDEAPSNTSYAYQWGLEHGGDMIELDVHATRDGQIVAIHDDAVDRTTNGHGLVSSYTLARLRRLDAAYNFIPGRNNVAGQPAADYPFRGMRTGRTRPPAGFEPADFRIPTLQEVFDAYPDIPVNVEIKGQTAQEKLRVAKLLAQLMKTTKKRDVIVVSFDQRAVDRFHQLAPDVDLAPGVDGESGFLLGNVRPPAGTKALQLPITYQLGAIRYQVITPANVLKAHRAGYAVHVYLDDAAAENDTTYQTLTDACVDGVMTADPTRFEAFLERTGQPRSGGQGGADDCAFGTPKPLPRGCRLRVSKLVTPLESSLAVRVERWGDLRGACSGPITLTRGSGRSRVVVARGHVQAAAGRTAAVGSARLTSAGVALVRTHARLSLGAAVRATTTDVRVLALSTR
jgi:glycerophosphoryl diester phosphodiesterase